MSIQQKVGLLFLTFFLNILAIYLNYSSCYAEPFNGRPDMLYLHFGNYIFFTISALSGIYFWLTISVLIKQNILLETFGKNTLIIMGLHIIILQFLQTVLSKLGIPSNIFITSILFLTVTFGSLICSLVIKKYFPFIIKLKYKN